MSGARTDAARRSSWRRSGAGPSTSTGAARRGRNGGVAGPDLRDAQVVQARRRVPEDREGTRLTARWSTAATAVVSGAGKSLGEGGERRTVMLSW